MIISDGENVLMGILVIIVAVLSTITMTKFLVFIASLFNPWRLLIATLILGITAVIYANYLNRKERENSEIIEYDEEE